MRRNMVFVALAVIASTMSSNPVEAVDLVVEVENSRPADYRWTQLVGHCRRELTDFRTKIEGLLEIGGASGHIKESSVKR